MVRLRFSAIIGAYAKSKEPDKAKAVVFNAINDARSAWTSKSKTDDSTRLALWWMLHTPSEFIEVGKDHWAQLVLQCHARPRRIVERPQSWFWWCTVPS